MLFNRSHNSRALHSTRRRVGLMVVVALLAPVAISIAAAPPAAALPSTTTVLTSSANPINVIDGTAIGDSTYLTATVTSANGVTVNNGVVDFYVNGSPTTTVPVSGGVATTPSRNWSTGGIKSIRAEFNGSPTFAASTSNMIEELVTWKPTATTVALANGPVLTSANATFNVSVSSPLGTPAGTVQLFDGGGAISASTTLTSGSASITTISPFVRAGTHTVTAIFTSANGAGWDKSVATTGIVVGQPATTLTISPSATSVKYGQNVSFAITTTAVTAPSTYFGVVKLFANGTYLTEGQLDSTGHVTLSTTALPVGSVAVSAVVYGTQLAPAFGSTTVTVSNWNYTLSLATSPAYVPVNDQVTLTATVQAEAGAPALTGGGSGVIFTDNGTSVVFGALTGTAPNYTATAQVPGTFGQHYFGAVVTNQPTAFASSSATASPIVVGRRIMQPTLTVGPLSGGSQTLQVTLSEVPSPAPLSSTVPTGDVDIYDNGQYYTTVHLVSGAASYTLTPTTGYHEYGAVYQGDAVFDGLGTRASATVGTDTRASASMSSGSVLGTNYVDEPLQVYANVTPAGATGSVSFYSSWNHTRVVAPLDASGHAVGALPHPPAGSTETYFVTYLGNTNYRPTSSALLGLANPHFPTVTLTNPGAYNAAKPVTLRATVLPQSNDSVMPTGTVAFLVDGTRVESDVVATDGKVAATVTLTGGTHTFTAMYLGDQRNSAALSTVTATSASRLTPTMSYDDIADGSNHTFVVHVTGPVGQPVPTGNIAFSFDSGTVETASLVNGAATFPNKTVTTGRHVIQAEFAGNPTYDAKELMGAVTGTEVQPTVTITPSFNPAPTSTPVTYTVTVAGTAGAPIPQGTVEIRTSSGPLAEKQLDENGQTQFTVAGCPASCVPSTDPDLPDGIDFKTDVIRADFTGDSRNGYGRAAGAVGQRPALKTSTNLYASPNPSNVQGAVTLASAVLASTQFGEPPNPTGTVTFYDGTTPLGTAAVGSNGVASLTTTQLPQGTRSLTARYSGSNVMAQSQNVGAWSQTVNGLPVTGAVTASPTGPVSVGTTVTYTATINRSGSNPVPTGKVTFGDDFYGLIEATLVPGATSSTASISLQRMQLGNHTITVNYQGDSLYAATHDGDLTSYVQSVLLPSTVSLSSSNTNSVATQSVTFTAGVGTEAGPATGTMQFMDGPNPLDSPVNLNGSGVATLTTSALTPGTHSITAVYSGSSTRAGNTSPAVTQTVSALPVNLSLTSSVNPSLRNQSITFTATATSGAGTPSGTVSFLDGTTVIGTGTLNGGGVATFSIGTLAAGTHSITATYAAQGNYGAKTSTAVSQVVNAATPSINLTSTDNPVQAGNYVTFSASVPQISGQPMPSGTFSFIDGTTTLATIPGTALGSTLVASFATNSLTVGSHNIKVYYSGDSTYAGMNSTVLNQLVKNFSSTSLSSSVNPSADGQSVTFSATVSAPVGGNSVVRFYDGETLLGQGAVTAANMTATFTTSSLSVGSHFITAYYDGDANNMPSFAEALTQKVLYGSALSSLSSSASPSAFKQSVTFNVSILAFGPDEATGTVTFKDGATTIGTVPVVQSEANFTTNSLSIGTHSISAVYSGDNATAGGDTAALSQVVTTVPTSSVVTSSANPSTTGSSVTFTATVTNNAVTTANKPSGTVTFKDGSTTLGTGTLNSAGVATFTTSGLTAGAHGITAAYSGDPTHGSTSGSLLIQTIQKPTSTSLASSKNPVSVGTAVTFTATISGSGTPSGSVTFKDGGNVLATVPVDGSSRAALVVAFGVAGSHSVVAEYSGDTAYAGSISLVLAQQVTVPAPAPTNVTATLNGRNAVVSFTPGDASATSFTAQCVSTTGGATRTASGPASPLEVATLSLGHTYHCHVNATNAGGTSAYSSYSATFVAPNVASTPTGVTIAQSGHNALVSFTPGDATATSFFAQCTSTNGGATKTATGAASPITVSSPDAGHTYQCRVRATNSYGTSNYSADSNALNIVATPAPPTNVTAVLSGRNAVVSFTPSDASASGFTAQCVSSTGGATRSATGTASPIEVATLSLGHTYQCHVNASNIAGTSAYSANSSAFVAPNVAATPTGVTVTKSGRNAVVSFTPGDATAISFFAQCTSTTGGTTRTATGTASPITVTNLDTGHTYQCRVRATNTFGTSNYSTDSGPFTV